MKTYDTIIIGAGHNGLVTAAYLAKAGKKVLVLERREIVGGSVVTESFGENFNADSVWAGGTLRADIIKDLKLASHGLKTDPAKPAFISLLEGSENLVLDADPAKAAESIKRFSQKDAKAWPDFIAFMNKVSNFMDTAYATRMPRLPKFDPLSEGLSLAELALELRLSGSQDMLKIIRGIPMTALEFAEEWFESEPVKAAVASLGIHGMTLGVMGAGTGFTLMHNWTNRGGLSHSNVGKAGSITQALSNALKAFGGEVRTNAEVKQVIIKNMSATGVVLTNGEEISARTIVSAADPKHTFLSLVGAMELPPEFVWKTQSIKMRGSVAKVHLLTDGRHAIPEGTLVLAPTLKYLERAYDAAKYHEISENPYLEVTSAGNVVSIHFQYAPYVLKNGDWKTAGAKMEKLTMDALAEYFPDLGSSIVDRKSITPKDLEDTYGLTEGDLNHGQLLLDQFMFMRPIPGWSNHKTPIDNLFLCGSGVHGGGGVSGASGRNAARILE